MMLSATDFLPPFINTLTNLATSTLKYFGSGRTSRFAISLRRGMVFSVSGCEFRVVGCGAANAALTHHSSLITHHSSFIIPSSGLRPLGAVLGAALLAVLDTRGIQAAAHDVVAHARQG